MKETINTKNLVIWTWIHSRKHNLPQKNCKGLTQWAFMPPGTKLIYTTANLPNLAIKTRMNSYSITAWINKINNQLEELGMIDLNPINQLMTTSEITQLAPSTQPSTNLRGKQRCMSDLYTSYRKVSNTPQYKFQDQLMPIQ